MSHPTASTQGRPPAFSYRNVRRGLFRQAGGVELYCDDARISQIVERYGTPLYLYSASTIRHRLKAFDRAFHKVPHTICYSVKANSNLSLLRLLNGLGCGFDVVSGGELQRVLAIDRHAAKRVVFSGVGKTPEEMKLALRAGILLFNVESESELSRLAECAARLRKPAPVALRVNPDVSAETHPYISTGLHQHKFGIPINAARKLYAAASGTRHLRVTGVSVHIGSQITKADPFAEAMAKLGELVRALRKDGHTINFADAGGGLGISYDELELPEFSEYVDSYATALTRSLRGLKLHLLLEPGRAIVGPAGALITTILYRKKNDGKKFVVTDAAMNDLLRPALYGAFHEIVPVRREQKSAQEKVDVVGPICETGDFFARERQLPKVAEGDLLAILDAGAYGMALGSNYNSRPRAAEVLVDGNRTRLVRRRETISDLLRPEVL